EPDDRPEYPRIRRPPGDLLRRDGSRWHCWLRRRGRRGRLGPGGGRGHAVGRGRGGGGRVRRCRGGAARGGGRGGAGAAGWRGGRGGGAAGGARGCLAVVDRQGEHPLQEGVEFIELLADGIDGRALTGSGRAWRRGRGHESNLLVR